MDPAEGRDPAWGVVRVESSGSRQGRHLTDPGSRQGEQMDRPHPPSPLALLVPSLRGGGAEGANVRLANELVRREEPVDLVVLDDRGPWSARLDSRVNLVRLAARRAVLAVAPLCRYLRRRTPLVIMAGPSHMSVVAVLARDLCRPATSVIVLEHNDIIAQTANASRLGDRVTPSIVRYAYARADRLLAVSRGAADSLACVMRLPPERVEVLHNGIDMNEAVAGAREAVRHPWFASGEPPVIVAIGRLAPQKGFPDLLRALAIVNQAMPTRLAILGEGPEKAKLEALVQTLRLQGKVAFLGFQANPYAYLARGSLFVLASHYEGFGIVLLEALACSAPVISTDCPSGPSEILGAGTYGLLVPVAAPEAMAEAILRVLRDDGLRQRLRDQGPTRAAEFSTGRVADRFVEIVRGLDPREGNQRPR
jgi:glycosyltransferase involved in cell wall biosynthesis